MQVKMHMQRRLGFGFGPKTLWAYKAYFVVSYYIFFYKLANYWPSSRALMKGGGAQEKN